MLAHKEENRNIGGKLKNMKKPKGKQSKKRYLAGKERTVVQREKEERRTTLGQKDCGS